MEIRLLTAVTAANGVPSGVNAGFPTKRTLASGGGIKNSDGGMLFVWNSAGTGTLTAKVRLWVWNTTVNDWCILGLLNNGNYITVPTGLTNKLRYTEPVQWLSAAERIYAELMENPGGSGSPAIDAVIVGVS